MLDQYFQRPVGGTGRFGQDAAVVQYPRPASIAPAGNQRGLQVARSNASGVDIGATLDGRFSLGLLQGLVVVLIVFYVWTRNVQAGG
jgi:hypothetical protein